MQLLANVHTSHEIWRRNRSLCRPPLSVAVLYSHLKVKILNLNSFLWQICSIRPTKRNLRSTIGICLSVFYDLSKETKRWVLILVFIRSEWSDERLKTDRVILAHFPMLNKCSNMAGLEYQQSSAQRNEGEFAWIRWCCAQAILCVFSCNWGLGCLHPIVWWLIALPRPSFTHFHMLHHRSDMARRQLQQA